MQMKRIILLSFVSMLLSVGTTMAEGISSARELVAFATAANALSLIHISEPTRPYWILPHGPTARG